MPLHGIQPSFAKGELAPALWSRIDLQAYAVGCRTLSNMLVHPHGGASNRPGTEYIASTKDSSKASRLIPFEYSTTQAYVLELGDYYLRVFKDGAQVVHTASTTSAWSGSTVSYALGAFVKNGTPDVIYRCISAHTSGASTQPGVGVDWATKWVADDSYEIITPWPVASIWDVKYCQSADTMYLTCPGYAPQTLTRSAHTTWTIAPYVFEDGPFMDENTGTTTMTLSSYGGSTGLKGQTVTVTASASTFAAGDVGRWIKIRYVKEGVNIANASPTWSGGETAGPWNVDGKFEFRITFGSSGGDEVLLEYSTDGGTAYNTYKVIQEISGWNTYTGELRSEDYNNVTPKLRISVPATSDPAEDIRYTLEQLREETYGYLKITTYTSATSVRATVMKNTTFLGTATAFWSLGSWGAVPGYPETVMFYQDRLCFANSASERNRVWMSKTGDYTNFGQEVELQDDDAVTISLPARSVNAIKNLIPMKEMLGLTSGGIWSIAPGSNSDALTPTSVKVLTETTFRAGRLTPVTIGNVGFYAQHYGNRVYSLAYSDAVYGYDGSDMSVMSQHLFDGYSLVDWGYQQEPWSVVWGARSDGTLLGFTFLKEHEVSAWHRHPLGGSGVVESVCVIPGTSSDEVWMIVNRTVNSATVRYVERLHTRDTDALEDAWFVDCALEYDSTATKTISGLGHLEGCSVVGVADGTAFAAKTVTSGAITFTANVEHVIVGLPYNADLETLNIEFDTNNGTAQGRKKRIGEVVLRLEDSKGGYIGPDTSHLKAIPYPSGATFPYTGDVRIYLESTFDEGGRVLIRQSEPYPLTILGVMPVVMPGG